MEDINLIHLNNRAGSTLMLTVEFRTHPVINRGPVGKADSCILCQGVTQQRLETSMKTQVTDAVLVKAGGVNFAMTVSEWSINFQNLTAGLWVSEAGQTIPPRQLSTHQVFKPLLRALPKCPRLRCSYVPFAERSP